MESKLNQKTKKKNKTIIMDVNNIINKYVLINEQYIIKGSRKTFRWSKTDNW